MKILWIIYPFCSIFILVGAGLSLSTMRGILKGRAIGDWPTTDATIVECDFKQVLGRRGSERFEVIVKYKYDVLGREYESDRVHPAYSTSSFDGHRKLYERLKDSTVVSVHYNEADPAEAYLLAGSFSAHLAAFFGGLIFLSAGIFFYSLSTLQSLEILTLLRRWKW